MTEKFANKYRIPSARLENWDYRRNAAYFVTICTHNRENYFGQVENGEMNLSGIGNIADNLWREMPNHAKMAELDAYVVMPNHIHGIVIIKGNDNIATAIGGATVDQGAVETLHATSLQTNVPTTTDSTTNVPTTTDSTTTIPTTGNPPRPNPKNQTMAIISPKPGSLSTIIRSYKSAVSKRANLLGFQFEWQTRFHDHIIRDESEFRRIRQYILNNPKNWNNDKFHNQ